MGKFREFLINEEIGLGDLGPAIDNLYHSQWFGNQIEGAFTSMDTGTVKQDGVGESGGSFGNQSMARSNQVGLPTTDMTVPSVTKEGRITSLILKKNPIYIRLSDGTEASFTYDEYKRIEGEPALGKVMTLIFQRHPSDSTTMHSKINKAIVRD
tara:strand:- start:692 stop:1153 length:462 start_codon:yes stop_codon:yes gene_type:complete